MTNGKPIKILQLSDTHLGKNSELNLLGVETEKSLMAVLDYIKKEESKIDCILLTGDISQDGSFDSYHKVAKLLSFLNTPVYCIPGNHDSSTNMALAYPKPPILNDRCIKFKNWQIILLDSHKEEMVEGHLSKGELTYLQDCLRQSPKLFTVVSFHHQPIKINAHWLDNIGIENSKQLWDSVKKNPMVKLLLFGHIHQSFDKVIEGIRCLSAPSTCIQFKPNHHDFALDNIPQGYRILELYPNGEIKTEVKRINEYVGSFDPHAKGY